MCVNCDRFIDLDKSWLVKTQSIDLQPVPVCVSLSRIRPTQYMYYYRSWACSGSERHLRAPQSALRILEMVDGRKSSVSRMRHKKFAKRGIRLVADLQHPSPANALNNM